jgi:hypothetical protein
MPPQPRLPGGFGPSQHLDQGRIPRSGTDNEFADAMPEAGIDGGASSFPSGHGASVGEPGPPAKRGVESIKGAGILLHSPNNFSNEGSIIGRRAPCSTAEHEGIATQHRQAFEGRQLS